MLENEAFADEVNPQKNKYIMFSAEKNVKILLQYHAVIMAYPMIKFKASMKSTKPTNFIQNQ